MHLQILRALAASLVVVDHSFVMLRDAGFDCARFLHSGYLIGHMGVAAFFVLSGLIMVRQSASLFGSALGPWRFAWRRITRIVPLYWLVTVVFAATLWRNENPHPHRQLLLSLLFIPNFYAGFTRLFPVFQLGWTLNYEMFFYLLFFLALFLRRRRGIIVLLAPIAALVLFGQLHPVPDVATPIAILGFYTNPFLLLFAMGVLLGYFEIDFGRLPGLGLPGLRVPGSPALLLLLPVPLALAAPASFSGFFWFPLLSLWSAGVVMLCMLDRREPRGVAVRRLVLLGDASYSTYLLHPLLIPLLAVAPRLWSHPARSAPRALVLTLLFVALANCAGLLLHLALERPIVGLFRRLGPSRPCPTKSP
jgi:peptidoglycan/LPS O-acetylase OafA/YrhL